MNPAPNTSVRANRARFRAASTLAPRITNVSYGRGRQLILHEKAEVLRRGGLLKYLEPPAGGLDLSGGNDNVKRHIERDKSCFSTKAKAFGIDPPRGLMLTGFCAPSVCSPENPAATKRHKHHHKREAPGTPRNDKSLRIQNLGHAGRKVNREGGVLCPPTSCHSPKGLTTHISAT